MIRDAIVARANAIVGMSRYQLGMSGTYAWCAHTVSNILKYVGINDMYDLSCSYLKNKMSADPKWSEPDDYPIPGDIIFFDWDREADPEYYTKPLDHVGVVTKFDPKTLTVTYVNGNGSSPIYVTRQTINVESVNVAYWMRYIGDEPKNTPTVEEASKPVKVTSTAKVNPKRCNVALEQLSKGCETSSVETMQILLNNASYRISIDGVFGDETEKVLKRFQTDKKLDADGICGPNTWKALIESI